MKSVRLTADEQLLESARSLARDDNTTLSRLFRGWLQQYVSGQGRPGGYREFMDRLGHVQLDRTFTREERNARS